MRGRKNTEATDEDFSSLYIKWKTKKLVTLCKDGIENYNDIIWHIANYYLEHMGKDVSNLTPVFRAGHPSTIEPKEEEKVSEGALKVKTERQKELEK
jgi:hypothetical protein